MANRGFQFKQFFIAHDRVAMKVGTDGIVLGSWVLAGQARRILDIGCGSGLLSIMLAQKALPDTDIIGIDIDQAAIDQASDNAAQSPWSKQLTFSHCALQQFDHEPFDLIVANPPYFRAGQLMERQRQKARHHSELDYASLVGHACRLLSEHGCIAWVIPAQFDHTLATLARQQGLSLVRHLTLYSWDDKAPIRVLQQWSLECPARVDPERLVIHQADGQYSQAYRQLCREYYLHF